MLAVGRGHAAVTAGMRVHYTTAADLAARCHRAALEGRWATTMRFYAGPRLLIIDLCRPRDYADSAASSAGPGSWGRSVAGIVPRAMITGCRGTPGSCRWGGICPAGR
jgi:hypothetical protein